MFDFHVFKSFLPSLMSQTLNGNWGRGQRKVSLSHDSSQASIGLELCGLSSTGSYVYNNSIVTLLSKRGKVIVCRSIGLSVCPWTLQTVELWLCVPIPLYPVCIVTWFEVWSG